MYDSMGCFHVLLGRTFMSSLRTKKNLKNLYKKFKPRFFCSPVTIALQSAHSF